MKNRIILLFIPMFLLAGCNTGGGAKKSSSSNQEQSSSSSKGESLPDKSYEVPDAEKGERININDATTIINDIKAYNETLTHESIDKMYLDEYSLMDDDFQKALLCGDREAQYWHSFSDTQINTPINEAKTEFYPNKSIMEVHQYAKDGECINAQYTYYDGYNTYDSAEPEHQTDSSKTYYHLESSELAENVGDFIENMFQGYKSLSNSMLQTMEIYLNPQMAVYAQVEVRSKGSGSLYLYCSIMDANVVELLYVDNVFTYFYTHTDLSTMGGIPGTQDIDVDYQNITEEINCSLNSAILSYPDLSEYTCEDDL